MTKSKKYERVNNNTLTEVVLCLKDCTTWRNDKIIQRVATLFQCPVAQVERVVNRLIY